MLIVGALILLALFVVIELEVDHPLLDVRLFKYWPFVNSLLLISGLMVGLFSVLFFLPLFLQEGQGLEPLNAGLLVLPQALVMVVTMLIAGWLYDMLVRGARVDGQRHRYLSTEWHQRGRDQARGHHMDDDPTLRYWPIHDADHDQWHTTLPKQLEATVSFDSALNNLAQRVSSSFGLAALITIATALQAQDLVDRAILIDRIAPRFRQCRIKWSWGFTRWRSVFSSTRWHSPTATCS
jgi:hypothetical protein